MTRHHIQPTRRSVNTDQAHGLGWWVIAVALLLPLAAIGAITWLGVDALVAQERESLSRVLRAEADLVACRVNGELLAILDTLESAALYGWDDAATIAGAAGLQATGIFSMEQTPTGATRALAVRHARAAGWTFSMEDSTGSATFVLAAADHPDRPSRVALAEISAQDLFDAIPGDPSADAVLLDRARRPLHESPAAGLWPDADANTADGGSGVHHAVRPVEDFPIYVGVARAAPSGWTVARRAGTPLVAGAAVCAVVIAGCLVFLGAVIRRRLLEADRKRSLAFREVEHVQKLSSIGRLAAGVAHEINNPLAIIAEKAGLMKDLAGAAKDMPKADRFVSLNDSILQAVNRCRAVTHRLLGFARRMEVRPMELDLNDVLRETIGFLERDALYRDITIDLELDENLPGIESDRGQLQQVFLNLLNNAMAAVSDKGRIRVATRREKTGVAVDIEDNGMGMSRETLAHIFDPFFSTKGEQGTGLGLSITYGIVDKLGGSIEVSSAEGEGSLFTVHLPMNAAPRGAESGEGVIQ
jgi:signal transduction histidine kinase